MKLVADLHTHSKYSRFFHGKNTIEQMAIAANEIGLTEIAITDHGFKHFCRTNEIKLLKAREEVDEINKWSKTKVLLGIEADIISEDGTLDVDEDIIAFVDILIIGYHRLIKTDFAGFFGNQKKTKEAIEKATNAYINAINRYPVTIVSHLDSILKTDLYKIGKACAMNNVMVEINNRHCKWTEADAQALIDSGCIFVVNSDAHNRDDVGKVSKAFGIVEKYNIPKDYIANISLDEDEMTEEDRVVDEYYSIYVEKQKAKEEKEKVLEVKKKTEFTNSLSDEMEDKLKAIAREKGLEYTNDKKEEDLDEIYNRFKVDYLETEDLIKQAKHYLNQNTLQEFDIQNVKVEGEDEFIIDQLNEDEEVKLQPVEQAKPVEVQKTEDEKILDIMKGPQKAEPVQKPVQPQAAPVKKSGVSIVKNVAGVAQTEKPVAAAPNKNGRSLESFMQSLKEETQVETSSAKEKEEVKKPTAKKGRGGVFIQIDELNDDKK